MKKTITDIIFSFLIVILVLSSVFPIRNISPEQSVSFNKVALITNAYPDHNSLLIKNFLLQVREFEENQVEKTFSHLKLMGLLSAVVAVFLMQDTLNFTFNSQSHTSLFNAIPLYIRNCVYRI